jgi:hypothetical protein
MKNSILTILSVLMLYFAGCSQNEKNSPAFTFNSDDEVYQISRSIADDFIQTVNKLYPGLEFSPKVVITPTPSLAFYDSRNDAITFTWWGQLPPEGQGFFLSLTESDPQIIEKEFGMLFNWFYIPHELAHALQAKTGRTVKHKPDFDFWQSEIEANEMAFAYFRSKGNYRELEELYNYAKKILSVLPDPVPAGDDPIAFFNKNYPSEQNQLNPSVYGYFQMMQKVMIYENTDQPSFEEYLARVMGQVE